MESFDSMFEAAKRQSETERQIAIELRECWDCGGALPDENKVRNPVTGETRESALCPKCRKKVVDRFMKSTEPTND